MFLCVVVLAVCVYIGCIFFFIFVSVLFVCWSLLLLGFPHGVVVVFLRCCRLRILFFVLLLRCRCRLLLRCYGRVWLLRCYGCVLLLPGDVTFSLLVVVVWFGFCFNVFVSLLVFC